MQYILRTTALTVPVLISPNPSCVLEYLLPKNHVRLLYISLRRRLRPVCSVSCKFRLNHLFVFSNIDFKVKGHSCPI